MAGFKTHITTSTLLGVGYTGAGLYVGMPIESSLIAGGLCGVGGMLPDIDSDSGVPFRESMGFAAAIVPAMLIGRFEQFQFNYEQMILLSGALYLFIRFGVARLLSRYTVHRGMFHSLPAAALFAGVTFLLTGFTSLQVRYFMAGGVLAGVLSHLILDEIYAVEWYRGRWRFKKSFGTALKIWGSSWGGNLSVYAKLVVVVLMILGEPMVMQQYGQLSPVVLQRQSLMNRFVGGENRSEMVPLRDASVVPIDPQTGQPMAGPNQPSADRTIYDTARRIWQSIRE